MTVKEASRRKLAGNLQVIIIKYKPRINIIITKHALKRLLSVPPSCPMDCQHWEDSFSFWYWLLWYILHVQTIVVGKLQKKWLRYRLLIVYTKRLKLDVRSMIVKDGANGRMIFNKRIQFRKFSKHQLKILVLNRFKWMNRHESK